MVIKPARMGKSQGFTLVELSIVLVIIGLLSGGVLAGKELINNAARPKVMRTADELKTAVNAFRDRYGGLPGDLENAGKFWSLHLGATQVLCHNNSTANPELTCSGDGNGNYTEFEGAFFFNQLYLAKLIQGTYGSQGNEIWNSPAVKGSSGFYKLIYLD